MFDAKVGLMVPARNPELENVIAADPDEPSSYLVYADWLQGQGDPRGDLIVLQQSKGETVVTLTPGKKPKLRRDKRRPKLDREEQELFDANADLLFGPFTTSLTTKVELTWRNGFLRALEVAIDGDGEAVANVIEPMLRHTSALFLRTMTVNVFGTGGLELEGQLSKLGALLPPTLRSLGLGSEGNRDTYQGECWWDLGKVNQLLRGFPELHELVLQGDDMALAKLKLHKLRSLRVHPSIGPGLKSKILSELCTASWPGLERLDLDLGRGDDAMDENSVGDVRPILDAKELPKLTHLGLRYSHFADDICEALSTSKVLAQLEVLDLSKGRMSATGVKALKSNAKAFKHLRRLDISGNMIENGKEQTVAKLCAEVVLDGQEPGRIDDWDIDAYDGAME